MNNENYPINEGEIRKKRLRKRGIEEQKDEATRIIEKKRVEKDKILDIEEEEEKEEEDEYANYSKKEV